MSRTISLNPQGPAMLILLGRWSEEVCKAIPKFGAAPLDGIKVSFDVPAEELIVTFRLDGNCVFWAIPSTELFSWRHNAVSVPQNIIGKLMVLA